MINITPAQVGDETVQTVNARELWEFLESKQDFSTWIKARIEKYEFEEGLDYVVIQTAPQTHGVGNRGAKIDYHISLDMAKELGQVEATAQGRIIRRYFIECERELKAIQQPRALDDPRQLRDLLLGYTEKVIQLEQNIARSKFGMRKSLTA